MVLPILGKGITTCTLNLSSNIRKVFLFVIMAFHCSLDFLFHIAWDRVIFLIACSKWVCFYFIVLFLSEKTFLFLRLLIREFILFFVLHLDWCLATLVLCILTCWNFLIFLNFISEARRCTVEIILLFFESHLCSDECKCSYELW